MQPATVSNATKRAAPSANVATAHGFATSNVTSKYFLGGQQRSWMTAPGTTVPAVQRPAIPPSKPADPPTLHRNAPLASPGQSSPQDMPAMTATTSDTRVANSAYDDQSPRSTGAVPLADQSNTLAWLNRSISQRPSEYTETPQPMSQMIRSPLLDSHSGLAVTQPERMESPAAPTSAMPLSQPLPSAQITTASTQQTLSPSASPQQGQNGQKRSLEQGEQDSERRLRMRMSSSFLPGVIPSPVSESHTPLPSPSPTAALYLPRLDSLVTHVRNQGIWSALMDQRASLLQDACIHDDLFFLCLHQISARLTLEPLLAMEFAFEAPQLRGITSLEAILLSNRKLPSYVILAFANFPIPASNLPQSGEMAPYIAQVKAFLPIFHANWNNLRQECFRRKFPPCTRELRLKLSIPSVILQRTFFNSILRQLGDIDNYRWQQSAFAYFQRDQARHLRKLSQPDGHESQNSGTEAAEIQAFGQEYFRLRVQFLAPRPSNHPDAPQNQESDTGSPALSTTNSLPSSRHNISQGSPIVTTGAAAAASISASASYPPRAHPSSRSLRAPQQIGSTAQSQRPHLPYSFVPTPSVSNSPIRLPFPPPANPQQRRGPGRPPKIPTTFEVPNRNAARHLTLPSQRVPRHDQSYVAPQRTYGHYSPGLKLSNVVWSNPGPLSTQIIYAQQPATIQQRISTAHPPTGHAPSAPSPARGQLDNSLVPPANFALGAQTNPNPSRIALHQAHLRSPPARKLNFNGEDDPELRLYQYFEDFALSPQILKTKCPFFSWTFEIPKTAMAMVAKDIASPPDRPDLRSERIFANGSRLYRLRCIQAPKAPATIMASDWAVTATSWPSCCFVSVNTSELEIRRKAHHGRDLPLDLTHCVMEGRNTVTLSIHHDPNERDNCYAIAIEAVKVVDHKTALKMPTPVSATDALAVILHSLKQTDGDDDIQLVDQHLSIDLLDPFMSTVFVTPVRGKHCLHRECFDLEAFLQSRTSRIKGGPTSPDEWRCPICHKDARPAELIVDGFLAAVRERLEADGILETRAILVNAEGWEPKMEKIVDSVTKNGGDRKDSTIDESKAGDINEAEGAAASSVAAQVEANGVSTLEIIELDD